MSSKNPLAPKVPRLLQIGKSFKQRKEMHEELMRECSKKNQKVIHTFVMPRLKAKKRLYALNFFMTWRSALQPLLNISNMLQHVELYLCCILPLSSDASCKIGYHLPIWWPSFCPWFQGSVCLQVSQDCVGLRDWETKLLSHTQISLATWPIKRKSWLTFIEAGADAKQFQTRPTHIQSLQARTSVMRMHKTHLQSNPKTEKGSKEASLQYNKQIGKWFSKWFSTWFSTWFAGFGVCQRSDWV